MNLAKLLVLSLAETTSDKEKGYAVIARNLDNNSWVIIPTLSKELFKINGKYVWDIFAITEADIVRKLENRDDVYEVISDNYVPYLIEPACKSNKKRKEILEELSLSSISDLQESPSWVGIIRNPRIEDLYFYKRMEERVLYNSKQTYYWECRLDFKDENGYYWKYKTAPGVAVKDMRFKAYWRDLMLSREETFTEKKTKWINYMQENDTYLLIEFYPSRYLNSVAVISGVLCINKKEARRDN